MIREESLAKEISHRREQKEQEESTQKNYKAAPIILKARYLWNETIATSPDGTRTIISYAKTDIYGIAKESEKGYC